MEQVTVISDEKLNGIIDDYMETHSDELVVFIQKQIDKAVKEKLRNTFQNKYVGFQHPNIEGEARITIEKRLDVIISKYIDQIEIDTVQLQTMVNKRVQTQIKKLKLDVLFEG